MRIQHNISAINTENILKTQKNINSKHGEKLSSGFKINRAGDDGLYKIKYSYASNTIYAFSRKSATSRSITVTSIVKQ